MPHSDGTFIDVRLSELIAFQLVVVVRRYHVHQSSYTRNGFEDYQIIAANKKNSEEFYSQRSLQYSVIFIALGLWIDHLLKHHFHIFFLLFFLKEYVILIELFQLLYRFHCFRFKIQPVFNLCEFSV